VPSADAVRSYAESFAAKVENWLGAEAFQSASGPPGAAEKRMGVLELAAMVNGLTGLEMMSAGKPVGVTWTEPLKPLSGLTERLIVELVTPC
jgi:hypothetical protein